MSETATQEAPETKKVPTTREMLQIKGDLRVATVQFDIWAGRLAFVAQEGERTEDGFVPTRSLGEIVASGETYTKFLKLVGEKPAPRLIMDFLLAELLESLEKPAQVQQQPQG